MSDQSSSTSDHTCMICGAGASFGFTTARGEVWICRGHRAEGAEVAIPPVARVAGPR